MQISSHLIVQIRCKPLAHTGQLPGSDNMTQQNDDH